MFQLAYRITPNVYLTGVKKFKYIMNFHLHDIYNPERLGAHANF